MTNWKKSSKCDHTGCVWVWPGAATQWVKDENGNVLVVWNEDWREFIKSVKQNG